MEPAVLVFLLYVMIFHELVCGWMEYRKLAAKPKKQKGPVWSARSSRSATLSVTRVPNLPIKVERQRDWRKACRIGTLKGGRSHISPFKSVVGTSTRPSKYVAGPFRRYKQHGWTGQK